MYPGVSGVRSAASVGSGRGREMTRKNNKYPLRGGKPLTFRKPHAAAKQATVADDTLQEVCGHPLSAIVSGLSGTCYCEMCVDEARVHTWTPEEILEREG